MKRPTTRCAHCDEPTPLYRRGRRAGQVRWHYHLWLPGFVGCPGSRKAPAGGGSRG